MKLTNQAAMLRKSGMTLIELTVVILVLLALIGVLFIGVKAYKDGADKAACVMNQRNVQQAVRSYTNIKGSAPAAVGDLVTAEFIGATPLCPSGGTYTFNGAPGTSALAYACGYAGHVPNSTAGW